MPPSKTFNSTKFHTKKRPLKTRTQSYQNWLQRNKRFSASWTFRSFLFSVSSVWPSHSEPVRMLRKVIFKLAGHWRHQSRWVSSTARRGLRAPPLSGSSFSAGSSTPSDPTGCARWWTLSGHGRTEIRKTQEGDFFYCRRKDQSISDRSPKWSHSSHCQY